MLQQIFVYHKQGQNWDWANCTAWMDSQWNLWQFFACNLQTAITHTCT